MTILALILALATLCLGLIDAWLAGKLALLTPADQPLTDAGVAMLLTLIFATLGVASAAASVIGAAGSTPISGQWLWVSGLILCFEGLGAVLAIHYAGAPQIPYRQSASWNEGSLANADPGVLAVLTIVLWVFSLASVPVWLVARASAKRDGVDLGFLAAFQIRASPMPDSQRWWLGGCGCLGWAVLAVIAVMSLPDYSPPAAPYIALALGLGLGIASLVAAVRIGHTQPQTRK